MGKIPLGQVPEVSGVGREGGGMAQGRIRQVDGDRHVHNQVGVSL
jgi:hypothetical protein